MSVTSCNLTLNLNALQINSINIWIAKFPQTYHERIRSRFPDIADQLISTIEQVLSTGRTKVTLNDFNTQQKASVPQKMEAPKRQSFAKEFPEISYHGGDSGAFQRLQKRFVDGIIECAVYNGTSIINPLAKDRLFGNALNRNIFAYKYLGTTDKPSLVQKIIRYTGLKLNLSEQDSSETIYENIYKALDSFNAINSKQLSDKELASIAYNEAYDAFTILSNFDFFINSYAPFVKVRPGFEEYEAKDKYEYIGPRTDLNIVSFKDDDARANKIESNTSDLAKALLNYFPKYNSDNNPMPDTAIGQDGFNKIMTAFKQWVNNAPYVDLVSPGTSQTVAENEGMKLVRSFYNGDEGALRSLFKNFCNLAYNLSYDRIDRSQFDLQTLRGIQHMFEAGLSKQLFDTLYALGLKTEKHLAKSTTFYNGSISNKKIQDNYKYEQQVRIYDAINAAVHLFRFDSAELFNNICKKYGIEFDADNPGRVYVFKNKPNLAPAPVAFTFVSKDKSGSGNIYSGDTIEGVNTISAQSVDDKVAREFIELVLGLGIPNDYKRILEQLAEGGEVPTLFNVFGHAIGLTLLASKPSDLPAGLPWDKDAGAFDPKTTRLKLYGWDSKFTNLQTFLGIASGADVASTLKNQEGNNIAAYQLTSMVYQLPKLALKMHQIRQENNSFLENPVYNSYVKHQGWVKEPITREDVNINNKIKKARDLTEAEVAYIGIMTDFYWNYKNPKATDIEFQNTDNADKNTHFCIPYSKDFEISYGVKLSSAISDVLSVVKHDNGVASFENAIYKYRNSAYLKILNNLYEDFCMAFKGHEEGSPFYIKKERKGADGNIIVSYEVKALSPKRKLEAIKTALASYPQTTIEQMFFDAKINFVPELHISNGGFNETLENALETYVFDETKNKFKERLEKQKKSFIRDLLASGLSINRNIDSQTVINLISDIGEEWEDKLTGEVALYKGDLNGKWKINPMLEAYFYSDILLSNSYNDILFGRTFFHPSKYVTNNIIARSGNIDISVSEKEALKLLQQGGYEFLPDPEITDYDYEVENGRIVIENGRFKKSENYYMHMEASRLVASYKRTVNAGATVHSMYPGKYGIDPNIQIAVINDLKADVFNMMGISDRVDAHDGAAFSSPIQSILENYSLPGAQVGMDKKTIFGDNDARYGMPTLLKWATFALTNDRRRFSRESTVSAEKLFKKMHSAHINKTINISRYYKSENESYVPLYDSQDHRLLTRNKNLYRYDADAEKYYLITNLKQNGRVATWDEIEVTATGRELGNTISRSREINSIYDIDQVFGGAYSMEYDPLTKQLKYTDASNYLVADIVCNEGLKDKMVSYIVNKSAMKVGYRNLHSNDVLKSNNNEEFHPTTVSLQFGGVQLNLDHDLNEADVTEMSQMISALVQNGFFVEEVSEIYEEIGNVVANALSQDIKDLDEDNQREIHQKLGRDLIETFSRGNKDSIGLAQAYLLKAAKELEMGNLTVNIPFSDPTTFGAFVANVISNINKLGIRRRYAGFAGLQVPSRGMVQHYVWHNGISYMDADFRKLIKKDISTRGITRFENPQILSKEEWENDPSLDSGYIQFDTYEDYVKSLTSPLSFYSKHTGIYNPDKGVFEVAPDELHPYIEWVNDPLQVQMGETIILVNEKGEAGEPIVLDNFDTWDRVRHLISKNTGIFRWSVRPMDLRAAEVTFKVDNRTYSIYDLDSVRANHYLLQLQKAGSLNAFLKSDANAQEKLAVIENVVKTRISSRTCTKENINNWIKLSKRKTKQDLKTIDEQGDLDYNLAFSSKMSIERSWLYQAPSGKRSVQTIINAVRKANPDQELVSDQYVLLKALYDQLDSKNVTLEDIFDTYKDLSNIDKIALVYSRDHDLYNAIKDAYTLGINKEQLIVALLLFNGNIREDVDLVWNSATNTFVLPTVEKGSVKTRFAEIVMGRLNAKSLGLKQNDSISEIQERKEEFFKARISADYTIPGENVISDSQYDSVLVGPNGERLFVALRSKHTNQPDFLEGFTSADNKFQYRNRKIFYKDIELCDKLNKEFYVKGTQNGPVYIMVVDDISEVDALLESPVYSDILYSYKNNNVKELALHQYNDIIDDNGVLTQDIYLSNGEIFKHEGTSFVEYLDNILSNERAALVPYLNAASKRDLENRIDFQAKQRFEAFKKQLEFVGARIPTQNMQSFSPLQVVGYTNSEVGEVYMPAHLHWLAGSDFDADKLYILGYEINNNGKLQSGSRLQNRGGDINSTLNLAAPTGIKYSEKNENFSYVFNKDVQKVLNGDYSPFNKILASSHDGIRFEDTVPQWKRNRFIKLLNNHSTTKLSRGQKESALKNKVVHKLLNVLAHPRNAIALNSPLTMDDLKKIAEASVLSFREKSMTSDNPQTKFIMQVQNMVGKDVIGITAVGMKVFFATTTFVNQRILDLAEAIRKKDIIEIGKALADITFNDPLVTGGYATIANVNFEPVFEALKTMDNNYFISLSGVEVENLPSGLNRSAIDLKEVIENLQKSSETIDAAEGISELLSAATDNAKELILSKINATVDFADVWSHLIATGHSLKEIGDLMMSKIFGIVSQYSKTDVFSDIISSSSPKKAIDFVLGKKQLSGVDGLKLKLVMGMRPKKISSLAGAVDDPTDNMCFFNKIQYETYDQDVYEGKKLVHKRGEIKLVNGKPQERKEILLAKTREEQNTIISKAKITGDDVRKNMFDWLGNTETMALDKATKLVTLLMDHIAYRMSLLEDQAAAKLAGEEQEQTEQEEEYNPYDEQFEQPDYEDYLTEEPDDDIYDKAVKNADIDESKEGTFVVNRKHLQDLYRYLAKYVLPKNNALLALPDALSQITILDNFAENIFPAVEEQQIIGSMLGVNQGLKTNQGDFYSFIKRIENFVNTRWFDAQRKLEVPEEDIEIFDVIKFLEDEEYRQKWIDNYDTVKSVTNPLKLIMSVPNFREMFKLTRLGYRAIQHAVQGKLNFLFADTILNDPTKRLNSEEFDILNKYTRDLLIVNFLFKKNISVGLPIKSPIDDKSNMSHRQGYWTKIIDNSSSFTYGSDLPINLNSSEGLATFVNMFETWIVPWLKAHYNNAFTKNLTYGHKFNSTHNQIIRHARLALNMMTTDASVATQLQFSEILKDFNKIGNDVIPEVGLSIKDAVFIYNMIVYKNGFTKNGFTRLMETEGLTGNSGLVNDWADFIAKMDANQFNLGDLQSNTKMLETDNEGNFKLGILSANINDLLYRLSFSKQASYKFGVTQKRNPSTKALETLAYEDMYGNHQDDKVDIDVAVPDANDWCLGMPKLGNTGIVSEDPGYETDYETRYSYDSREVVDAIGRAVAAKFGISIGTNPTDQIQYITIDEINESWKLQNSGQKGRINIKNVGELSKMLDSKGFIHNGTIYIVRDKLSKDTVLHEILHMVFAAMKFNPDPKVRKQYYDILQEAVTQVQQHNPELYRQLRSLYETEVASDFKEEILVHQLTNMFSRSLKNAFGGYQTAKSAQDLAVKLVSDIMDIQLPKNVNTAKLGNTTLRDICLLFKSGIMGYGDNALTKINIQTSQKIKTFKRILIEAGEKEGRKNYIKYDC